MTDTRVEIKDASRGLIAGYAVVWNRWIYGSSIDGRPVKFRCLKSNAYQWAKGDIPLLADHDFAYEVGEVFGGRSVQCDNVGIKCWATLRNPLLLIKVSMGQLYFSPFIVSKGGSAIKGGGIVEVTLTDNPGLPPSPRHIAENEATNERLDTIRDALATLPPDADEESVLTALEQFLGPTSAQSWAELRRQGAA